MKVCLLKVETKIRIGITMVQGLSQEGNLGLNQELEGKNDVIVIKKRTSLRIVPRKKGRIRRSLRVMVI